ncbi:MAG TPA: HD-GYP domain-containing protein [Gemmatimonadaceae bacterium]|nr:HD-GYP domain-containing protein [Gemmatimonadaceae bacterium]
MSRVRTFVAAIAVVSLAALFLLAASTPAGRPVDYKVAICFALLGALGTALSYPSTQQGSGGNVSFIPFLSAIALSPTASCIALLGVSTGFTEIATRRRPLKATFNVSQQILSLTLAAFAYRTLAEPSSALSIRSVASYAGLVYVFIFANTAAVSVVVALSERRNPVELWKERLYRNLAYDLLALPVVYLFARVYSATGPTGAIALAVPLLGVRQLYKTNWQLERVNRELLELMAMAIEARDPYTSGHSRRVAHYSRIIARSLSLPSKEIERIAIAALLHDVGKIYEMYAPLLRKPTRLTLEERMIMQTHPVKSAELVQTVSHLRDIVPAVRHHHENWDGSGYPDGLVGDAIPLGARIIMLADTIDAMTTDRPYRKALGAGAVLEEINRLRGRQFDPKVCDALITSALYTQLFEAFDERGRQTSQMGLARPNTPASQTVVSR